MAPWNETSGPSEPSVGDPVIAQRVVTGSDVTGMLASKHPTVWTVKNSSGNYVSVRPATVRKLVPIGVVSSDIDVTDPVSKRVHTLRTAERLITGDRNRSYGEPTQNFQDIADLWNTQFRHLLKEGSRFSPADIAAAMVAVKLVRRIASSDPDNWIDMAGYAACGAECDSRESENIADE